MSAGRAPLPPSASLDWAYFLDVDGTLIDIAATPETVIVDAALLKLIDGLHRAGGGALALVSGRSLANLAGLIGMPHLPMAGQHGLERRDASGRCSTHPVTPGARAAIKQALAPALLRHPGLLLEDKGQALTLHYRLAPQLAAYAHRLMRKLLLDIGPEFELQKGKCVAEIKPVGGDKGTAIAAYLAEPPFRGRRPVFIGDDLNDEHGFAEVNRRDGVSIKVGKGRSCARFHLSDVAAVKHWLGAALKTREAAHTQLR